MKSCGLLFVATCAVALPAAAQPWMERLERHPSPIATLSFVDVTDNGIVLGEYSFAFQTTQVDTGFLWTRAGNLQLIASAPRWNASCISPDAQVAFGSTIPDGAVISYVNGSAGTSSSNIFGRPLASNQSGSEAYGSFSVSPRTPMVFVRQNPAASFALPLPSMGGTQTRDVEVAAASFDGKSLFGNANFLRTSDQATISRAVAWSRNPASVKLLAVPFGNSACVIHAASSGAELGAGAALSGSGTHQPWLYFANVDAWAPLPLVDDDVSGDALDISAAGRTLVGNTRGPGGQTDRGRVWCNALKFSGRSIESLLSSRGLSLTHWTGLSLRHVSPDGQYLIGDGFYDGVEHSWAAFVGKTCCPGDINDDGSVDLDDFFAFFNCWDATAPCADIDSSPGVDLADFFAFFNSFDTGC